MPFWKTYIPILMTIIPSAYFLFRSDAVIESVDNFADQHLSVAKMGWAYGIYSIPSFLSLGCLSYYFIKKSTLFKGYEKAQLQWYVIGALAMYIPIVLLDYIVPIFTGVTVLYRWGPIFGIFFTTSVAYSMLRNRFLGVKSVIGKAITFFVSSMINLAGFFAVLTFVSKIFTDVYSSNSVLLGVFVLAPIYTLFFLIVTKYIERWVKRIYINSEVDYEQELTSFNRQVSLELDVEDVVTTVVEFVCRIFSVHRAGVILFDEKTGKVIFKNDQVSRMHPRADFWGVAKIMEAHFAEDLLIRDEVEEGFNWKPTISGVTRIKLLTFMRQNSLSLMSPILKGRMVNGLLLVGNREDERAITHEESDLMLKIIANTNIAVSRSLLYSEVRQFNIILEKKVEDATIELKDKIRLLEEAQIKERDMIDIMGHELRTPATIVKTSAELLTRWIEEVKELLSIDKLEEFYRYHKRILQSIDNEIRIINTLLASAKLEGKTLALERTTVDIVECIALALEGHMDNAYTKGLWLTFNRPSNKDNFPYAFADRVRLMEILDNLIGNAVKYTDYGGVTVDLDVEDSMIFVSVTDTGPGIDSADIPKLGTKFFRLQQYTDNETFVLRPGGTGLGLYVVYGLVEAHGGQMFVESEVGKGSKFTFNVPVFQANKHKEILKEETKDMFKKMKLRP